MTELSTTLNPHAALIYVMVVVSAADARMSDAELHTIGDTVRSLPVFKGFHDDKIIPVARECAAILQEREGLDAVMGLVKEALSPSLRETAYALALDVALAEAPVLPEENRILQRLRSSLDVDRLTAAALEKAAVVRHARITI
jgi:tellurite resistance protein